MNRLIIEPGPSGAAALDPNRHARKCSVCKHAQRDAIEAEFLDWRSPQAIGAHYRIHKNSIYSHAHALGLFARRRANMSSALETLIEQAEHAPVTGQTIINALRAYSCLQDDGRWVEPPTHVIYSVERLPTGAGSSIATAPSHTMEAHAANAGATLRDSAGRFTGLPPEVSQELSQPDEFLIVSPIIRNDPNSMETKEATQV